jgi:hypothetical protein
MSQEEHRFADLTAFEAALASLTPRVEGFDRERLFFLAGQASVLPAEGTARGRRADWGWPAAFSAMTAVAASLLIMLGTRGQTAIAIRATGEYAPIPTIVEHQTIPEPSIPHVLPSVEKAGKHDFFNTSLAVAVPLPQWLAFQLPTHRSPRTANSASLASYAELREQVLRYGVESYRPTTPTTAVAMAVVEEPPRYRELRQRLLKEEPSATLQ